MMKQNGSSYIIHYLFDLESRQRVRSGIKGWTIPLCVNAPLSPDYPDKAMKSTLKAMRFHY